MATLGTDHMTKEAQEDPNTRRPYQNSRIHCSDPSYLLRKYSKPIGCQINLILNSWRFPQYVLWAWLADISPVWPQRSIWALIGVSSSWYFDYSYQGPLTWLCVYFWLTDITLAILNSICKSKVKSSIFVINLYTYRLSAYFCSASGYLPLHDNNHQAQITCYHPPPSKNVPGPWNTASEPSVDNVRNDLLNDCLIHVVYSTCLHFSENCWSPVRVSPLRSKGTWYHSKTSERKLWVACIAWGQQLEDAMVGMQTTYQWQHFTSFVSLFMKY